MDIRKSINPEGIKGGRVVGKMTISIKKNDFHTDNPFHASAVVTNKSFAGRERVLAEAFRLLKTNKNVVITAEKGMGKTSFIAELARRYSNDFEFAYVDIYGMTCQTQFLQMMTRELIGSYRTKDGRLSPEGWEILRSTRLRLAVLQKDHLTTSAINDIQTLAPPTKKDIEIADKIKKKIEIRMCPDCGKPLKWIEKHSRHYCYSCRKYLPRQRKVRAAAFDSDTYLDKTCPACGHDTSFDERYSHYYCDNCKRYPFVHLKKRQTEDFKHSDMMEVLELPQKIANQKDKQVVVMFDEFQDILSVDAEGLLKAMRSTFETHTDVSYVFVGRNWQTMQDLFESKDGFFQKFANPIELGPIAAEDMEKFLTERFKSGDGRLTRECAKRITALGGRYPGHAQRIAHELFHISKEPSQEDLDEAIRSVIEEQSHAYESFWDTIRSPLQRRYLLASVTEPRASHGADFINRYDLRSRSHIQRVETQLEAKGIVRDGEVIDPLFILWLRDLADLT